MNKWLGNHFLELSILCIMLIVVGGIFELRIITMIGLLPIGIFAIMVFGTVVGSFLDDILPEFKGKWIIVIIVSVLIIVLIIMIGFYGGIDDGDGVNYRGTRI